MTDISVTKILDPTNKATPKVAKGPKQYANYEPWKSIEPEKIENSKWAVVGYDMYMRYARSNVCFLRAENHTSSQDR